MKVNSRYYKYYNYYLAHHINSLNTSRLVAPANHIKLCKTRRSFENVPSERLKGMLSLPCKNK